MNYKIIILIISIFLLFGCNQYENKEKSIVFTPDSKYKNTGFALIYTNKLKKDKKISKKINISFLKFIFKFIF